MLFMKKNMIVLLLVFIGTIASILIIGQRRDGEDTVPATEINESIKTFAALLNKQNIQSFGLKNIDQLKTLRQGKQYKKYMIELDDLKGYKAGDDPEDIIKTLPVTEVTLIDYNGKIITSTEFTKEGDKWKVTGFGLTPEMIGVSDTQPLLNDSIRENVSNGRLVTIPALHTNFIAITGISDLDFIVLEDNKNLEYTRGELVPASDALLKLIEVANIYNGLPN